MIVFITISNFLRTISPIDKKPSIAGIYKSSLTVLSIKERERLALIREIFINPDALKISYKYNKLVRHTKRDYKFVYESSTPSYHANEKCSRLKSNFDNYEIPQEIRDKGEKECEKYIKWFSSNVHLLEQIDGRVKFLFLRKAMFELENDDIGDVHEINSGSTKVENTELNGIEKNIDDLIIRAIDFKRTPRNIDIIIDYGDDSNMILEDKSNQEILVEWHRLKKAIKDSLIQYYMIKYNPKLQFEDTLLEQVGFKKCTLCSVQIVADDLPF